MERLKSYLTVLDHGIVLYIWLQGTALSSAYVQGLSGGRSIAEAVEVITIDSESDEDLVAIQEDAQPPLQDQPIAKAKSVTQPGRFTFLLVGSLTLM